MATILVPNDRLEGLLDMSAENDMQPPAITRVAQLREKSTQYEPRQRDNYGCWFQCACEEYY